MQSCTYFPSSVAKVRLLFLGVYWSVTEITEGITDCVGARCSLMRDQIPAKECGVLHQLLASSV